MSSLGQETQDSSSDGQQLDTAWSTSARIFAAAAELAERLKPFRDRPDSAEAILLNSAVLYFQIKHGLKKLSSRDGIATELAAALNVIDEIFEANAKIRSTIPGFAEYLARSNLSDAAQRGLELVRLEPKAQAGTPEGFDAVEDFSHTVGWVKRLEDSPGELVRLLRLWDDLWDKQKIQAENWRDVCDSCSPFVPTKDDYLDAWGTLTELIIAWCDASHPNINTPALLNLIELYCKWQQELFHTLYLVDIEAAFKGEKKGLQKRRVTTAVRLKVAKINSRFETVMSEIGESVCEVTMRLENLAMAKMGAKKVREEPFEWTEPRSPDQWEQLFQVSWKTLRRRIDCGTIRAQRINSKSYRLNRADLPRST